MPIKKMKRAKLMVIQCTKKLLDEWAIMQGYKEFNIDKVNYSLKRNI